MLDILIFGGIAVFVVIKLRKLLGNEYEQSGQGVQKQDKKQTIPQKILVKTEKKSINEDFIRAEILEKNPNESEEVISTMIQICKKNPLFSYKSFFQGSEMLFEHIISSYSSQNLKEIQSLCSQKVAENFQAIIDQNKHEGVEEIVFISKINEIKILKLEQKNDKFSAILSINSDQIQYTQDCQTKEIKSGSKSKTNKIVEQWTLERIVESSDPNWIVEDIKID